MSDKKLRSKRKNDPALRQTLRDRKQAAQAARADFTRGVLQAMGEYPSHRGRLEPFVRKNPTRRRRKEFQELLRDLRLTAAFPHPPTPALSEYVASFPGVLPVGERKDDAEESA